MTQPLAATKVFPDWGRLFTHGVAGTTLSLYFQGNTSDACNAGARYSCELAPKNASHPGPAQACSCPSDLGSPTQALARIVLGVFEAPHAAGGSAATPQLEAVAVGMYPYWRTGTGTRRAGGTSTSYGTPTLGTITFENVQLLNASATGLGVRTGYSLDAAKTTLTIATALPRTALPGLPELRANVSTGFDLSCNMGGEDKFFWQNVGFRASILTYDEHAEAELYRDAWGRAVFV